MSIAVGIPKKLYEEAVRRGVDVESRVVELLARDLGLDPRDEAPLHLELAERFMGEGRELLREGDAVQASEKLYKVAEECIKAMAEALNLEEAVKAREVGRWTLKLLDAAAKELAERVSERVYDDWDHAYFLHVEGFHEARLGRDQVEARVKYVEELLQITKKVIQGGSEGTVSSNS